MEQNRRNLFDDVFDNFSMLVGENYVTLYDIKARLTRYSPAIVDMIGLPGEYIPDGVYNWMDYIHPEDRENYESTMEELLSLRKLTYDIAYRVRMRDGEYMLFRFVGGIIRDMDGKPSIVGGMMINSGIVENIDRVTGMKNAERFFRDIEEMLRGESGNGLLLIGFGRLAHVNEVYGYGHGSKLLLHVGRVIEEQAKEACALYRMEGSRFMIVTKSGDAVQSRELYERIRRRLRQGIEVDGMIHNLLAYGGFLSLKNQKESHVRALYDCLQHACNESRTYQRGDLIIYDGNHMEEPGMSGSVALINAVRRSIQADRNGFFLLYQPIFGQGGTTPIGAEALLRFRSEEFGTVLPERFLSEIEQDRIFVKLGNWIVENALRDGVRFRKYNPDFGIAINVAASQLNDTYYIDNVVETAERVGFPLSNLALEITRECRFLQDMQTLREFARSLHERGIRLGIDDFSRGNVWLKSFGELTPDYIKFGQELTDNLMNGGKDVKIIRHLSEMVADCGSHVFIKGIENETMLSLLRGLPITGMQGNYFCKPVYFDEIEDLLCDGDGSE